MATPISRPNLSNNLSPTEVTNTDSSRQKKYLLISSIALVALVLAGTYLYRTSVECSALGLPMPEEPVFNSPDLDLIPQLPPRIAGNDFQIGEIRSTEVHSLSDPEFLEKFSHLENDDIKLTEFEVGSSCLLLTKNGKPLALYQPNDQQHDIGSYTAMLVDKDRFFNVPSVADIDLGFRTERYLQGGLATEYIEKDPLIKQHIDTNVLLTNNMHVQISSLSVQKLAVLDFLIQNQDRHAGNILLRYNEVENCAEIIPIDHNRAMPSISFDLYGSPEELKQKFNYITSIASLAFNPHLTFYNHLAEPTSPEIIDWIQNFDPMNSLPSLSQLKGFSREQLNGIRMRSLILKTGAKNGWNLQQTYKYAKENMPQVAKTALELAHEALNVKYGTGCFLFAKETELEDLFFKYSEILASAQMEKSFMDLDSFPELKKMLFQDALTKKSSEIRDEIHITYFQSAYRLFKRFISY